MPADVEVTVLHLLARKDQRDRRRAGRAKRTSQQWPGHGRSADPEDQTLRRADGYRYFAALDTSDLDVARTVARIRTGVLEVGGAQGLGSAAMRHGIRTLDACRLDESPSAQ